MRVYHPAKANFFVLPVLNLLSSLFFVRCNKVGTDLFDWQLTAYINLFQILLASKEKSLFCALSKKAVFHPF